MDNKITKKRLNDFLAYEWVFIVAIIIASIFVWELLFNFFSVRLTVGQEYKLIYDRGIDSTGVSSLSYEVEKNEVFGYDFLNVSSEAMLGEDDTVLINRIAVKDADSMFASSEVVDGYSRAKGLIDREDFNFYNFERLLSDAQEYLGEFMIEAEKGLSAENLSEEKVKANFLVRMKKDNRFRKEEAKAEGIKLEIERIKRLIKEVSDFEYLLSVGDAYGIFYRYTRFEQVYFEAVAEGADNYESFYEYEINAGRKDAIYALNMERLTSDKKRGGQDFAKLEGKTDASNTVFMVFNFCADQRDLQFENISLINTMVKSCTHILDGR